MGRRFEMRVSRNDALFTRKRGESAQVQLRHYKFPRITLDPNKCFGKPCIRGLRFPVSSILLTFAFCCCERAIII